MNMTSCPDINVLVASDDVRSQAIKLATEVAVSSPLAVKSIKATMQKDFLAKLTETMAHESAEQHWQFSAEDFKEGVAAMTERRQPQFKGK
jgi:enoyl-CoA hydratase/carnithine racemase